MKTSSIPAAFLFIGLLISPSSVLGQGTGGPIRVQPPSPVARSEGALGILANPAGLAFSPGLEFGLIWGTTPGNPETDRTTLLKLGPAGVAVTRAGIPGMRATDVTFGSAWRLGERFAAGYSYTWTGRGANIWSLGLVRRFNPWVLSGLYATDINQPDGRDPRITGGVTFDLMGSRLLVSAEATAYTDPGTGVDYGDEWAPAYHVRAELLPGVRLHGTLRDDAFFMGLDLGLGILSGGGMQVSTRASVADAGRLTWLRWGDSRYSTLWPRRHRWVRLRLADLPPEEPIYLFGFLPLAENTLLDLLLDLDAMADDPYVDGVLLELGGVHGGWASLQEVHAALERIREEGKQVLVWGEDLGMGDLFLASAADSVFVAPAGGVQLTGLAAELEFFGSLLEKLGVRPEFVKIDEYKTAPETYTRSGPTPENLEMTNWLLDDLTRQFTEALRTGRRVTQARVDTWFAHGPYTAAEALEAGLVDGSVYPDQFFGEGAVARGGRPVVSYGAWREERMRDTSWIPFTTPRIAVINASGAIVSGVSGTDLLQGALIGADTVARALREARADPLVGAIVLRVDSPGGSALASDLIWREVVRSGTSDKPLIVSMGDVAASGGYYISCGADYIFADPGSITGSIGIFAGKFDLSGLYAKIGYDVVRVERGAFAGAWSMSRGFTDRERERLGEVLQQGYDQFLQRVSRGRGMDPSAVDAVGRGRVWTGNQAVENGLVDRLGGLLDAVEEARDRAGLSGRRVQIRRYPAVSPGLDLYSAGRFLRMVAGRGTEGPTAFARPSVLDGLRIQLDVLERLSGVREFYLMPAFLHVGF